MDQTDVKKRVLKSYEEFKKDMDTFQKGGDENRTEMQKDLAKAHPGYHKIEAEPLFTKHDSNYYKAAGIEVDKKFDNSNDYIKPGLTKPQVNTDKEQEAAEGYLRTAGADTSANGGITESEKTFEGNIMTYDSFLNEEEKKEEKEVTEEEEVEKVDELYMGPGNPAFDAGKKAFDDEHKKKEEPKKEVEEAKKKINPVVPAEPSAKLNFEAEDDENISKITLSDPSISEDDAEELLQVRGIFATSDRPESYSEMREAARMAKWYWNMLAKHPALKELGFAEEDVNDPRN